MVLEKRINDCEKCGTTMSKCYEYNERWLCSANSCLEEEIEKDSGKHLRDEEDLDDYRDLVARTSPQSPSVY